MEFTITKSDANNVSDAELTDLLTEVYVQAGFVTPDDAITMFNATNVRQRGTIFIAREVHSNQFAGMVIIATSSSTTRRVAQGTEAEMQLFGVKSQYRGQGLGQRLVVAAIDYAQQQACPKMMLFTQLAMHAAQHLYEKNGFVFLYNLERNNRHYKIYERMLHDQRQVG